MTRREWFETLPPAYAERAIRNTAPARDLDEECRCLATAVGGGFIWVDTPEGDRFWDDVQHGELPPIPGEEPAPDASDYPEPPTGFAVVMGPLARLATEYEQRDIAGRLSDGWIGQGLSLTSSTWTGCDEGFPYALRIGSRLAIDNGLSGIPDTQPAYRYFHIPDTDGVWRVCGDTVELACVPANEIGSTGASAWGESNNSLAYLLAGGVSGQIVEFFLDVPTTAYRYYASRTTSCMWRVSAAFVEYRTSSSDPWDRSAFADEEDLIRMRNPNPCDEQGNLITLPAPASPAPKVKYRITEVRHYFLEAEDEIEADKMFRDASDPARKFRMHIEDREVHNDA